MAYSWRVSHALKTNFLSFLCLYRLILNNTLLFFFYFSRLRKVCQPLLWGGALLVATSALAGLTDASPGLLAWVQQKWGADAPKRLAVWQRVVADSKVGLASGKADAQAALVRTNTFFNQVPYFNDIKHWGVEDYWATPVEMLGSFGGDCEDYSVGKYLTLKDLGVPIEKLRITYVRALQLNESHMVLAYYPQPDADPLILDNLVPDIKPASLRTDLEPVYSFNDDDLWLPTGQSRKGGSSQVRQWKELLDKLAREKRL